MRVKLVIPDEEKYKSEYPKFAGEHYGYDGMIGEIVAGAGKEGSFVRFGNSAELSVYVGCPNKWLHKVN